MTSLTETISEKSPSELESVSRRVKLMVRSDEDNSFNFQLFLTKGGRTKLILLVYSDAIFYAPIAKV